MKRRLRRFDVRHSLRWACIASVGAACACTSERESPARADAKLSSEVAVWRALPVVTEAVSRMGHVLVFDSVRSRHVVFGGRPVDDDGPSLGDGWTIESDASFQTLGGYAKRGFVRGVFDRGRGRTVVFGGVDVITLLSIGPVYNAETWELETETWQNAKPQRSPPKRASHGLTYDSARAVTVLFGGYDGVWLDDLWEYDGTSWEQACQSPTCDGQPRPSPRASPVLVYDEARAVTLLFGGSANGRAYGDTWTWDGERWKLLDPRQAPPARDAAAATYDPITKRVLIFGGASEAIGELGDLWAWDGVDWTLVENSGKPVARQGAGMVWDATRRSATLFGGATRATATDAWQLQITGNACRSTLDCHLGACAAGVCDASGGSGIVPTPTEGGTTATGGVDGQSGAGGENDAPIDDGDGGVPSGGGTAEAPVTSPRREDTRSLYSCSGSARSGTDAPLALVLGGLSACWLLGRRRSR